MDQQSNILDNKRLVSGIRLAILVVIVAGLGVAARFLPMADYLERFLSLVDSLGTWGILLFVGVYVSATVLMVPGSILTVGAGFLFGLLTGTIVVSLASVTGATIAFVLGRTLAREFVAEKVKEFPKFAAVDQAVGDAGFKIVLLTRLSPLFPFNALNYLLSVTSVRLRDYVLASWVGMLPGTVMYVYFGTAIKSLADLVAGKWEGGTGEKVLLGVGLVATVAVTVYVTRLAGSAIRKYVPAEDSASATEAS